MKKSILLIFLFLSICLGLKVTADFFSKTSTIPESYHKILFPTFNYQSPSPKDFRHKIHSKSIAYFLPSKELDLIEFSLYIPTENIPQNHQELVLYPLFEQLIFSSGTDILSPKEIADSLELMAANINISIEPYQTSIHFSCFGKDTYKVLSLLQKMMFSPRFDSTQFHLQKQKLQKNTIQEFHTPQGVLSKYYPSLIYQNHPLTWIINPSSFLEIQLKDLQQWNFKGFQTNKKFIFSVAGNFNIKQMQKKLNTFTKTLTSKYSHTKLKSANPLIFQRKVQKKIITRKFSQTTIKIGYQGVQRPHPDYYPLTLIHHILGGGLSSKFSQKIRSEHGLAYSIFSKVESNYHNQGSSYIFIQTKKQSTSKVLNLLFKELKTIKNDGFTHQDLQNTKRTLLQSLYALFKNNFSTATTLAQNEVLGRDFKHFQSYSIKLNAITLQKLNEVFNRYFIEKEPSILIVGPKEILKQDWFKNQSYTIINPTYAF